MKRKLHKLKVKILCCLGFAIDISSVDYGAAGILSNFTENHFVFDGVECASMEGFLQSLKHSEPEVQERICSLVGKYAKRKSVHGWKETQTIHWKGHPINRHSNDFQSLVRKTYRAMADQCPLFRDTLLSTGSKLLYHSMGNPDATKTILTEKEFCTILTELRKELNDNKQIT